MKSIGVFLATLVSTAIIFGACVVGQPADQSDLDGTSWVLMAIDETAPIEKALPTLEFEGRQISGNAGCNIFRGAYKVRGDAIEFTDLYNTEMFCMDPEGVMEQEQWYLDLLRNAWRFELTNGRLILLTESDQSLTFQKSKSIAGPSPTQDSPEPTTEPASLLAFQPPIGFKDYRDAVTGISIFIPESWHVTGIIEGEYAILQSYPEDKYVGGEAREPGDAKCDLNIRPAGETEADIIQVWESNDQTAILSKTEISLGNGAPASRFVLNNMGRANVVLTRLDGRVVKLTCFGDFTMFDQIAATLRAGD